MSNVDSINFFKFLTHTEKNGKDWFEQADTNCDDVVIKAEFRTFLNNNSAQFKEITGFAVREDIISKFWNQLDTSKENKNIEGKGVRDNNAVGRGTEEYDKLSKNLETLNELELFYTNTVIKSTPTVLTESRAKIWQNLVYEALSETVNEFIRNGNKGDLKTLLATEFANVKNTITASQCDDEYKEQLKTRVLKDYKEYNIDQDAQLNALIDSYIAAVKPDAKDIDIYNGMVQLIDAYLAASGISDKTSNNDLLKQYGYESNPNQPLNDLQKATLEKRLTDELLAALENDEIYANNKDLFEGVIKSYINDIVTSTTLGDFNTVKVDLETFKNCDLYKECKNKAEVKNVLDFSKGSEFYNALLKKLGYDSKEADAKMAEALSKLEELPEYNKAVETILADISKYSDKNGLKKAEVIAAVVDSVADAILAKASYNVNSEQKTEAIKTNYNEAKEDASHISNTDTMIERNRTLAINTCAAIVGKSDSRFAALIKDVFGTQNYIDTIKKLTTATEIQEKVTQLLNLAIALEETIATEKAAAEERAKISSAAGKLSSVLPEFANYSISSIANKGPQENIHTEFGIDKYGNIVFQDDNKDTKTAQVYDELVRQVQYKLKNTDQEAYNALGGDAKVKKLVQAAWIMSYNKFNSSAKHNTIQFLDEVIKNLESILKKIEKNPDLLDYFTAHTAYANKNLTNGLKYYEPGNNDTYGRDDKWDYKGGITGKDKDEYDVVMNDLLSRILSSTTYSAISESTIRNIFNKAKAEALKVCQSNITDCPYGTGNNSSRVTDDNVSTWKWGGKDSRKDDDHDIHVSQLVELTLYFFDKLLYAEMVK